MHVQCDHSGVKIFHTDSLPLQNQSNSSSAVKLTALGSISENTLDFPQSPLAIVSVLSEPQRSDYLRRGKERERQLMH